MALDTGSTYVIIHWDVAEISGYDPASSTEHGNITDYCLLSCHKPAISSANYPPVFETGLKTDAWFHGDQTVETSTTTRFTVLYPRISKHTPSRTTRCTGIQPKYELAKLWRNRRLD